MAVRDSLMDVLAACYASPRKLQSNYARDNAYAFARLASLQLLTTRITDGFGDSWRVTSAGLALLEASTKEIE